MERKRFVLRIAALALLTAMLTACEAAAGPESPAPESGQTSSSAEKAETPTAEVLPESGIRELKIFGASVSDHDFVAVFGECTDGATVTAVTEWGETSVLSDGGSFAMRLYCPEKKLKAEFSQSVEGKRVGNTAGYSQKVIRSDYLDGDWRVLVGYENRCFFSKMLPGFQHTDLLDEETVAYQTEKYASRVRSLAEFGCGMVFVIAPSSITVYPEDVPEEFPKGEGESRMDQVGALLRSAGAAVIDLRSTFAAHKDDELPLYYNFDSHWTDYGAFLAYTELFGYISETYPAAGPRDMQEYSWERRYCTIGDMPYYFDVDHGGTVFEYACVRTPAFEVLPVLRELIRYEKPDSVAYSSYSGEVKNGGTYETGREEMPDLWVFRNSFGTQLYDLLIDRGGTTVAAPMSTYTFNLAELEAASPDYVIYVISEWDMDTVLEH